ncbi:MAG: hypothetical protein ACLT3D_12245 [Lawsonibacter sp.]
MVGSSDSIADANVALNAIVAEALCDAADVLEQAADFSAACSTADPRKHEPGISVSSSTATATPTPWVAEAARRGLPNLASLVDAVPALTTEKAVRLFTKFGIYTQSELEARAEIMYETYIKVTKIEANTMIHMASKHYIPTVISYTTRLAQSITSVSAACPEADLSVQRKLLTQISDYLSQASCALEQLKPLMERVDSIPGREGDGPGLPYRRSPCHGRPPLSHRRPGAAGGQVRLAGAHLRRPDVRGVSRFPFPSVDISSRDAPEQCSGASLLSKTILCCKFTSSRLWPSSPWPPAARRSRPPIREDTFSRLWPPPPGPAPSVRK